MRKHIDETSVDAPILSGQYRDWLNVLKTRYRSLQVKTAVSVNSALLEFYWRLGKDISETYSKADFYGTSFFRKLSADLQIEMPGEMGFSPRNIRYCVDFYNQYRELLQQPVAKVLAAQSDHEKPQAVIKRPITLQELVQYFKTSPACPLFQIP